MDKCDEIFPVENRFDTEEGIPEQTSYK